MSKRPKSDALVLFGATGDLARKKIFPAVYEMERGGTCGAGHRRGVLGMGRRQAARAGAHGHRRGRSSTARSTRRPGRRSPTSSATSKAVTRDPDTYDTLAAKLVDVQRPLFYLAIPPAMFDDVVQGLARQG